jgi:hypothetical protein
MEMPYMLQHYPRLLLILATAVAGFGLGGCERRGQRTEAESRALAESAAVYERQVAMFRRVGETPNLQAPESARYDSDLDVWFVSNINGDPAKKDNNGFIIRLSADGSPDTAKFIAGGRKGVTLNAPKGMAIVGDTLWVADLDAVRAFNKQSGAPIITVNVPGAKFLNDVAVDNDGTLYVTDTGLGPGLKHLGPDRVYQIKNQKATVALESSQLQGPNGIAWSPGDEEFVIVSFLSPAVFGWEPGSKQLRPLGTGPGQEDGVEVLPDGGLVITSWADSSLFLLKDGKATKVASGVASPADIGINGKRVAVPQLMENKVQFWELP